MGKKRRPFLTMIWKLLQRYGNIPSSCPIRKGHYHITDFDVDDGMFPNVTPLGTYKLDLLFAGTDEIGLTKIIQKITVHATVDDQPYESDSDTMEETNLDE